MGVLKKHKGSKASAVVKLIIMCCVCYYFHGKSIKRRAAREQKAAAQPSKDAASEPESVIDINADPEWQTRADPDSGPGRASAAARPPRRTADEKFQDMKDEFAQGAAWGAETVVWLASAPGALWRSVNAPRPPARIRIYNPHALSGLGSRG